MWSIIPSSLRINASNERAKQMDLISLRAPDHGSSRFLCPRAPAFNIQRAQPEPPSDRQASQQNFAGTNFRSDEISPTRNFTSVDAKFRQDDGEIPFDENSRVLWRNLVAKYREISSNFHENNER